MFKCEKCKLIFTDIKDKCPECDSVLIELCPNDTGTCNHGIVSGLKICELCGKFMCPICGSHDVSPISRVTGYYSPVEAWAAGKKQELIDRTRYDVV